MLLSLHWVKSTPPLLRLKKLVTYIYRDFFFLFQMCTHIFRNMLTRKTLEYCFKETDFILESHHYEPKSTSDEMNLTWNEQIFWSSSRAIGEGRLSKVTKKEHVNCFSSWEWSVFLYTARHFSTRKKNSVTVLIS